MSGTKKFAKQQVLLKESRIITHIKTIEPSLEINLMKMNVAIHDHITGRIKHLLVIIAFFAAMTSVQAQSKVAEGIVTYAVEWQLPPEMKAMESGFPKELKVYFKGDSSSMVTESQMYFSIAILNTSKEYERLLIDIPSMGKKYSVIMTPDDQVKIKEKMPELSLQKTADSKTVAGYKAQKYNVNEKKTNQKFEAWFTKDVDIVANSLSRFYDKTYGFPVEFSSFLNGVTIKATVKDIKKQAVPAGIFSASKEHEEITLDQLMQMSGQQ